MPALSTEQITLVVLVLSIVWGTIQHHWTESARKRDLEETQEQREADAAKLLEDRLLLAAELEHRRLETAKNVNNALEKRAAEIRQSLDDASAVLLAKVDATAEALESNTALTQEAVEHAQAAYHEANTVNEKIAALTEHAVTSNEQGNALMTGLGVTGDDTLRRVKKVEDAVVQSDAQLAAEAVQTEKRLTRLEDKKQVDQVVAHQTRRLVETGEDTNRTAHEINDKLEQTTP